MLLCPCGSKETYEHCCALFLEKNKIANTPEQLMRSRYTAYSLAKIDYIKQTMKDKMLIGFNEIEAKKWALGVTWISLEVIQSYLESPNKGFVEFCATFIERDQLKTIHELSEFHKESSHWFYVDGTHKKVLNKANNKIARNNPCPCGSGKKFKNCHG